MGISFEHPLALLVLLLPIGWWAWAAYRQGLFHGPKAARSGLRKQRITPQERLRAILREGRPGPFGWMRAVIVLLLVLALAGTGISFSARNQAVMFIADVSTSVATTKQEMEEFIKRSIASMPQGDLAGVLLAGQDAQLEAPVSARPTFSGFTALIKPDHTDLERGLRLGAALLPNGYRKRIVLLSDGMENVGNAMAEVQRLRQRGYTVDVVNFAPKPGPEALIKSIEAPGAIRLGERVELTLTATATAATPAILRIYEERSLIETRRINLQPGDQEIRIAMEGLTPGYHRVWATLEAEKDTLSQNNESAVMVNVQGAPSVLVVEGYPGAGTNIVRALESTGMAVEVRTPDGLPTHGPQFSRWASVVMVDVPAPMIRSTSMEALNSYVKQGGHGLVVIGGENSYAMGGYAGTKLEELLPVTMDVPQRIEKPPVAVALIIENFESDAKIDISKEAGKALVDMLTENDYILVGDVTIIGGWQVPPTKVTDKARIKDLIDAMAPGDPPHYMDHIEAAANELRKLDAKVKHIVFAGDGDAQAISFSEYASRIARIAADGITLSTVHVNWLQPGEEVLMQLMAQVGQGRYYLAADPRVTPQIFLKEAQAMARPGIIEEDFYPGILTPSPILQGLNEGLPALRGYVATTPKPTGEVILQSAQADPIMATWQAGLGRTVAFTSDAGGLWSEEMVTWRDFNRFWSNVVTWTMPAVDADGIRTTTTVAGGKAIMTVQLPGEGLAVGGVGGQRSWPANITAGIIRPDGSTQVMPLQATAPGQYEGEIPASMPGPYLVKLSAGTKQQSVLLGDTFVLVPYSPEFMTTGSDPLFMGRLAGAGGGKEITDPKTAFARDLPRAPGRLPLDQILLAMALLLWPIDIAMRRLALTPAEIREALRRRRQRGAAAGAQPATAAAAALDRLRERRAEAPVGRPAAAAQRPVEKPIEPQAAAQPAAKVEKPAEGGSPFTQRLLDARRKKQ